MSRLGAATLAVLLLTVGLAGCLGMGGDDAGATEEANASPQSVAGQPDDSSSEDPATQLEPIAYPASNAQSHTIWANGTYSAQDSCLTGGCFTGNAFQQVDLSSKVPDGAPVRITAELSYPGELLPGFNTMAVYLVSEGAHFYSYEGSDEAGHEVDRATVWTDGASLAAEVGYFAPNEPAAEVDYTLRIDIEAGPSVVPAGVPTVVSAEPGQTFVAEPADPTEQSEGSPGLLVYGPDDTFLTEATGDGGFEVTIPETSQAGEHVVVATAGSPALEIRTNATDPTARPLPLTTESGEPHPVEGTQAVEWSFELSTRPLAVGMYYTNGQPAGASTMEGQATIQSPETTVLEDELGCGFCIATSFFEGTQTSIGADGVAAGSYGATFQPSGEVGFSVGHYTVTYER